MIPVFTVYVNNPPTKDDTQIVRVLSDAGFVPLVDSFHKNDYYWFQQQYNNCYKFFWTHPEQLLMFTKDVLTPNMYQQPSFSIAYHNNAAVDEHDWRFIHRFFEHLFYPCSKKPKIVSRRIHLLLNTPVKTIQA